MESLLQRLYASIMTNQGSYVSMLRIIGEASADEIEELKMEIECYAEGDSEVVAVVKSALENSGLVSLG